jgi:hypothetical protein
MLGVRDLRRDGAPRANRFSNGFSNLWMSFFARRALADTQCGLRRYPLPEALELGLASSGYELEAEVILKAVRAREAMGMAMAELLPESYGGACQRSTFPECWDVLQRVMRG